MIFICLALILLILTTIDYKNFFSRLNLGSFLGIIGMIFSILVAILSNYYEAKNKFWKDL